MNVLVIFPLRDGQTGPAIVKAFENLGADVTACDTNTEGDLISLLNVGTLYDLIVCGRELELVPIIDDIRKQAGDTPVVVINPDVRDDIHEFKKLLPLFRRASALYTVGYGNVKQYRAEGINAFWLPQGLQDEVYTKLYSPTLDETNKFRADVSFIGHDSRRGLHKNRSSILDAIEKMGVSFKCWGCRGGEEVWDHKHNLAVTMSDINIAHSGWSNISRYWSVRAYKIMGAGGFVLANYHRDMEEWLPITGPEKILDFYRDENELVTKIRYYLDHPQLRTEIARRGHIWAQANTYTQRMQDVTTHTSSPQFFFHHYTDVRECNTPVPDPRDVMTQPPGKQVVATITTKSCVKATQRLIKSLQLARCQRDIHVFTTESDFDLVAVELAQPGVTIRRGNEWYNVYEPDTIRNKDARYMKPTLFDMFNENDTVVFVDGADTLVFDNLDELFDNLNENVLLFTEAERKGTSIPPGFLELFPHTTTGIHRFNSGVWGFKKCVEAQGLFSLWKAFSAWSMRIGHGDQLALVMALNTAGTAQFGLADKTYNWLPAFGEFSVLNSPVTADGTPIKILHGAGGAISTEAYETAKALIDKGVPV